MKRPLVLALVTPLSMSLVWGLLLLFTLARLHADPGVPEAAAAENQDSWNVATMQVRTTEAICGARPQILPGSAASDDDPRLLFNLGGLYYYGDQDVAQDFAKARKWLGRAADQGHATAQFLIGRMHYRGQGVPKNPVEARRWLAAAAGKGQPSAQGALALLYANGEGGEQDLLEAYKWSEIARSRGSEEAEALQPQLIKTMTAKQLAEARRLAAKWEPFAPVPPQPAAQLSKMCSEHASLLRQVRPSLSGVSLRELRVRLAAVAGDIRDLDSELFKHFGWESRNRKLWRLAFEKWIANVKAARSRAELQRILDGISIELDSIESQVGQRPERTVSEGLDGWDYGSRLLTAELAKGNELGVPEAELLSWGRKRSVREADDSAEERIIQLKAETSRMQEKGRRLKTELEWLTRMLASDREQ